MRRRLLLGEEEKIIVNGYEFVDLGLSVKWATCNIGATKPEEYGWYFHFGGTIPYKYDCTPVDGGSAISFGLNSNCPYWVSGNGNTSKWSKYTGTNGYSSTGIADNKTVLELKDDAAHVYIGEDCRMPTEAEYDELINACDTTWVTNYNGTYTNGRLFTLKSNPTKTLFFPAGGFLSGTDRLYSNSRSSNWSSSLYSPLSYYAMSLGTNSNNCSVDYSYRHQGRSVRAVLPKPKESVDMGLSVKWATCNIGADNPWDLGLYFYWGGTEGYNEDTDYSQFSADKAPYFSKYDDSGFPKYSKYGEIDNKLFLEPEDDAAYMHWGSNWRMPTKDLFQELIDNSNCLFVENYNGKNVNGILLTSKINSKLLFFPESTDLAKSMRPKSQCYCWSNENVYSTSAHMFAYDKKNGASVSNISRYCVFTVRAISSK